MVADNHGGIPEVLSRRVGASVSDSGDTVAQQRLYHRIEETVHPVATLLSITSGNPDEQGGRDDVEEHPEQIENAHIQGTQHLEKASEYSTGKTVHQRKNAKNAVEDENPHKIGQRSEMGNPSRMDSQRGGFILYGRKEIKQLPAQQFL